MTASVSSIGLTAHRPGVAPIVSREGDRTVVWLDGENDVSTTAVLADTLSRAISRDDHAVVVDLSGVTFIGAATIGVLIRGQNFLRRKSRTMTLRSPSTCSMRVLEVCGLTDLVEPG